MGILDIGSVTTVQNDDIDCHRRTNEGSLF
jgi:hypothetical protein